MTPLLLDPLHSLPGTRTRYLPDTLTSLQVHPESKACYPLTQTQVPNFTEMSDLPSTIFIFAGEGAHSASPDLTVLKTSPSWATCGVIASTEFRVQSSECI